MALNNYEVTMNIFGALCNASQEAVLRTPQLFRPIPEQVEAGCVLRPSILAAKALDEIVGGVDRKVGVLFRPQGLLKPFSKPLLASFSDTEKRYPVCMLNPTHLLPIVGEFQNNVASLFHFQESAHTIGGNTIQEFYRTLVTIGGYLVNFDNDNLLSRKEHFDMLKAGQARMITI